MAWSFVRPADPVVLAGRPLLDVGTGDGQTLLATSADTGVRIGLDRSSRALRAARASGLSAVVVGFADELPIASRTVGTVLAADLLHHAADDQLDRILTEAARVLVVGGVLVAWWYGSPGRGGPDDPAFPRPFPQVALAAERAGFVQVAALELAFNLEPAPSTVGLRAVV